MPTSLTSQLTVFSAPFAQMNYGVFSFADRTVLVDPSGQPEDLETLRSNFPNLQPDLIILTHSHWDHILGPRRFPQAPLVAQQRFTEAANDIRSYIDKVLAATHVLAPGEVFELPLPETLVDQQMEIGEGENLLRLIHTPGHSPDHLSIFHPASGTLWAGDLLSDVELPMIIDSFTEYESTIRCLAALAPQVQALVPGHGSPTTDPQEINRRVQNDLAYVTALRERVANALPGGLPAVLAACQGMTGVYPGNFDGEHTLNVETLYAEMGGATDGPAGWRKLL